MDEATPPLYVMIPENRPVAVLTRPLVLFASSPASAGIILLVAAVSAVFWANSPWYENYLHLWDFRIGLGYQSQEVFRPLHFWINDGLMTIFFLLVGLEIKREVLAGELASPLKAALPIAAALGGVLVPALVYSAFNAGKPGQPGWGIPMATDIAFVAGVLALLGRRIPAGLAVFLTALAIVDDIFAVLVIAVFYTSTIHWTALAVAGGAFLVLMGMNRLGVAEPLAYAAPGLLLWLAVLDSGVHSTIAGVLLALTIPSRRFLNRREFVRRSRALLDRVEDPDVPPDEREEMVEQIGSNCRHAEPPLNRMEEALRPWVSFLIMPLFAFANAGVRFSGIGQDSSGVFNPVTAGVAIGLVFGKPIGIMLFSAGATRFGLATRPDHVNWGHIHGASWLAGIGFTMSLFVGHLAFGQSVLLDNAKIGIFLASFLAGSTGSLMLLRRRTVSVD